MLKFSCKFDLENEKLFPERIKSTTKEQMESVGEESVKYAIENGTYSDVTGTLRSSNKHKVEDTGLTLINDAEYASDVEARGYDVIGNAALYAESRLKEIFE